MVKTISIEQVRTLALEHYDLGGTFKALPGELDFNFYVESAGGGKFVLKIYHVGESYEVLEAQNALLLHLAEYGPTLTMPKVIPTVSGKYTTTVSTGHGQVHYVRLLSWVEGRVYAKVNPHTPRLLNSLGRMIGQLCNALQGFDHPAAHRYIKWDVAQAAWTKEQFGCIKGRNKQEIAFFFYDRFVQYALPQVPDLRKSVLQNDANDYNVLVNERLEEPEVISVIDFGDFVYTPTIHELAIAIAYAAMDHPDPLKAATQVVAGAHSEFQLEERELAVLYDLVAARLLISVTCSAVNIDEHPENEYLQISEQPAWDLLKKWRQISPALARYAFRSACGLEPCLYKENWKRELVQLQQKVSFPIDLSGCKVVHFDLSVGSTSLGHYTNYTDDQQFGNRIQRMLEEEKGLVGIGGYGEVRPFYTTDAYEISGNNGPQWRTVHLGLDVWTDAGTPVLALLEGVVVTCENNKGDRNYGPTIILEHRTNDLTFYTLYGHLSLDSLEGLQKGQEVEKGQAIAKIGAPPDNGNWPPHLHFQIILDRLGNEGDFPGVAFPDQKSIWMSICPDPLALFEYLEEEKSPIATAAILAKRQKILAPNLSLSYKKHLTMLRGKGPYLMDDTGRRYLDTVNNVAHVGHEHPRVVEAARKQNALLNTNTRYLHPNIVEFAESLLETLPDPLEVAFIVNSGSEATELAIRLARTYTGRHGLIPVAAAYHGNTGLCVDISSYKFDGPGGKGAPDFVHVAPMPDPIRGKYKGDENPGLAYASALNELVQYQPAAFICESILSCGGQIVLPKGYLKEVYRIVRSAGGVCIADEVQTGVGRVGEFFWAFQLQEVVPDIVTIGKPIGNGHPLAAVVTTRAVADAFNNGMEFFNTFGGNPVSCAIGSAVLRVVQEEGLQENALTIGKYLMDGLNALAKEFPIIKDVRGHGLFLGYELVRPTKEDSLAPAANEATYLSNRLQELGVLSSTDGPLHNVIKIKPPMVFNQQHADFLLEMTGKVLKEDSMRI